MVVKKHTKQEIVQKKENSIKKVTELCDQYKKIVIVSAENVNAKQLTEIRAAIRKHGVLIFGKKSLIRFALKQLVQKSPKLEPVLHMLKGNIGLIFTNADVKMLKDIIVSNKVAAAAKQGQHAPCDVTVPKGNTGMEPTKTSMFQVLNITTKITKGTVEVVNDAVILKSGDKVGANEAALLKALKILPFFYGVEVQAVYDDGCIYGVDVLDTSVEDYTKWFQEGIANIASISLETGYMTEPAMPHVMMNGFKDILNVCVAAEYETEVSKDVLAFLKDPSKFAAPKKEEKKEEKKVEKKEEKKEEKEEEEDIGFGGLF